MSKTSRFVVSAIASGLLLLSFHSTAALANTITETFTMNHTFSESGISQGSNSIYSTEKNKILVFNEFPQLLGTVTEYEIKVDYLILRSITVSTDLGDSGSVFSAVLDLRADTDGDYVSSNLTEQLVWPWNCPCDPQESESGPLSAGSFSVKESAVGLGGPLRIGAKVNIDVGQGSIDSLSWSLDMNVTVTVTYEPNTGADIAAKLLQNNNADGKSPRDVADACVDEAIALREFGAQTASTNLDARAAEYFCRGLSGGYQGLFGSISADNIINDLANRIPISLSIYNGFKAFKEAIGQTLAGDDELPNSPPGGEEEFLFGHELGDDEPTIEEVIQILQGDPVKVEEPCVEDTGCDPTLPQLKFMLSDPTLPSDTGVFSLAAAEAGKAYLFDPPMTSAYSYFTPHNRMTELKIPLNLAGVLSNTMVVVGDESFPLAVGEVFDFTALDPTGVPSFTLITDVAEEADGLEMLVVLKFLENGEGILLTYSSGQSEESLIGAGHSGAWYNPDTSGQGQLIDIEPESGFMFLAWFTYTDDDSDNPNQQHWLTAQGNYSGNKAVLPVYETLGGQFDDPAEVDPPALVGSIELTFDSCTSGQANYSIDSWDVAGSFPLTRVIPGSENVCLVSSGQQQVTVNQNDVWDGAWYNADTSGQGFLIDSKSNAEGDDFIFVAWFTYGDTNASGQRWLTAQGPLTGNQADITVYEITGGSFDDPAPVNPPEEIGSMTIEFTGCNTAQLSYDLTAEGLQGSMDIIRVIPGTEALCESLGVSN